MSESTWKKLTRSLLLRFIGKTSSLEEIRKTFYRVIIIDMFWTESDLPDDLERKIEFSMNPSWPSPSMPENFLGLRHLSEEMLKYLCSHLKRPEWVDKSNTLKVKMSFNEIVKQWPFLFDLNE